MKNISLLILFSVLILSCKKEEKKAGISWFPGTMEEGLKKAKAESKPLFVYWGAKWCPPCNVLRATTFKEDKFIQATNKFISIFLDGDTDQAQEWGEKLSAQGYPTLMILSPQGKEIVVFLQMFFLKSWLRLWTQPMTMRLRLIS